MIDEDGMRVRDPQPVVIDDEGTTRLIGRDGEHIDTLSDEECFELMMSVWRTLQGRMRNAVYGQPPKPKPSRGSLR